ncbi:hypothetical protein DM02DRAFT_724271 [Periconia macrospinosa]|uniref:Uncharacterized protein n=1 Tax=Periconia macrospinosa TaxID=97972 RepID=A0A2V1E940_9PLEO|nr:hypothetical protein DM02DRAFT_724271 [Periconia macrospinosa]
MKPKSSSLDMWGHFTNIYSSCLFDRVLSGTECLSNSLHPSIDPSYRKVRGDANELSAVGTRFRNAAFELGARDKLHPSKNKKACVDKATASGGSVEIIRPSVLGWLLRAKKALLSATGAEAHRKKTELLGIKDWQDDSDTSRSAPIPPIYAWDMI